MELLASKESKITQRTWLWWIGFKKSIKGNKNLRASSILISEYPCTNTPSLPCWRSSSPSGSWLPSTSEFTSKTAMSLPTKSQASQQWLLPWLPSSPPSTKRFLRQAWWSLYRSSFTFRYLQHSWPFWIQWWWGKRTQLSMKLILQQTDFSW